MKNKSNEKENIIIDIPGTLDEWECIDLECGHFDGDMCTLGGCFDPPDEPKDE